MLKEKKFGSIKRFGPRYGLKIKKMISDVEKNQRKRQKCPYCNKLTAKRIAAGIWECSSCVSRFTGNAYFIEERIAPIKEIEEEAEEVKT